MSDEEVPDQDVDRLERQKDRLMREAIDLREQLRAWEKTEVKTASKTEKDFLPSANEFQDLLTPETEDCVDNGQKKCVSFSSFIAGIQFTTIDKKWLSDKEYLYRANVKTRVLEFSLRVTVDAENADEKNPEVLDVVCDFINIRQCYFIEITSWVRRFTEAKDISNLFSAISDYTEHNITRMKILRKLQDQSVITSKEWTEEDGGILVLLHAKDDPDFVYFEIRWILKFAVSLWRIDNCFIIQPISAGDEFLEANNQLLQSFCKCRIKKTDLDDMWKELCSAVELDETQSTIERTS